jgi:integrase
MSRNPDGADAAELHIPKNRPNERGHLRFDRRFPALGVPRLQRLSGTSDPEAFQKRNALLTHLAVKGYHEELVAFASGEISIDTILNAVADSNLKGFVRELRALRAAEAPSPVLATSALPPVATQRIEDRPSSLSDDGAGGELSPLARPLWSTAIEVVIPGMGELSPGTRRRYANSIRALQRKIAAFAADDEAFEALVDLWGAQWDALEQARMRGLTTRRLTELLALEPTAMRAALKDTDTRVGDEVLSTIRTLPRGAVRALSAISEYLVDAELVHALDRLRPKEPAELRESASKLGAVPAVGDLSKLTKTDWRRFARSWGGSGADWNHARRALSAFLTDLFGTSHNDFRYRLMEAIEMKEERERVVDLPPTLFLQILDKLPPEANAFPMTLVLTGAQISEYERLERRNLKPRTCVVEIPGTKTQGSVRDVHVDQQYWHYVDAAVPAPREYGWLRRKWKEACLALDVFDVTLHDLRHCHGQWALLAGAQEQSVQTTLGHKTAGMTRRYTRTLQKGEVAQALGSVLRGAGK